MKLLVRIPFFSSDTNERREAIRYRILEIAQHLQNQATASRLLVLDFHLLRARRSENYYYQGLSDPIVYVETNGKHRPPPQTFFHSNYYYYYFFKS